MAGYSEVQWWFEIDFHLLLPVKASVEVIWHITRRGKEKKGDEFRGFIKLRSSKLQSTKRSNVRKSS